MKRVVFLFLIFASSLFAQDKTDLILQEIKAIKEDIKFLREDMNKRFEQKYFMVKCTISNQEKVIWKR